MTIERRVYGPPGTGKTTWLAEHASADARRYGEDQVSVCSLTNAAVREAIGRDLPLDPENVTTLHARCKRALNAPAPAESLAKDFIEEYPSLADQIPESLLREFNIDSDVETLIAGRQVTAYEEMNLYRQQLVPPDGWDEGTLHFYAKWQDFCAQTGHMDFTGWLETAWAENALPRQQVVYVDEAQDHTPLQLMVIRGWRAKERILVGDDDQNLYEWSGAIPRAFLSPELPPELETVLGQSYRVPRSVHKIATRWVQQLSYRHTKEYLPRDHDGEVYLSAPLGGVPISLDAIEMDGLPGIDVIPDRTMLLASCGYMLDPIMKYLRDEGIPFHNPYRPSNKRWNPLESSRERLRIFLQNKPWSGDDVHSWASALRVTGAFQKGLRDRFLTYCEKIGAARMPHEHMQLAFTETIWPRVMAQDVTIFSEFRKSGLTGSWDYAVKVMQRPPEKRQPNIVLGTIHSVKGGQAHHVFLFPDLSRAGMLEYLDVERKDRILRLMYVGMTRAYQSLTLCSPSSTYAVRW